MSETVEALLLDLLESIGSAERGYAEVMEAWRTSCPRLPVWEEATERGYVARHPSADGVVRLRITERGAAFLAAHRPLLPHRPLAAPKNSRNITIK